MMSAIVCDFISFVCCFILTVVNGKRRFVARFLVGFDDVVLFF